VAQWDDRLLRVVRMAAVRSHSAQRGFVELEDLQQEGYVYLLENWEQTQAWLDDGKQGLPPSTAPSTATR
jgi:hypothetical protein